MFSGKELSSVSLTLPTNFVLINNYNLITSGAGSKVYVLPAVGWAAA